jgi:prepilin-type N-terminal cleavage/methylation domain-containing protein
MGLAMAFGVRMQRDDGFTLVELVIAMAVILVAVLGTLTLLDRANAQTSDSKSRQTANGLIRDIVETAQGVRYNQLTSSGIKTELQSNGFSDDVPASSTWEVSRNGITFKLDVTACIVDDPNDGLASHASGAGYCADSPAGSGDSNGDDYRRVTITATPPTNLGQPLTQTTVVGANRITNPGGTGPGGGTATSNEIKEMKITGPSLYNGQVAPCSNASSCTFPGPTTATVTPKAVSFRAVTAYTAQRIVFTVDGQVMATLNGPGTTFDWTWTLPDGQPDGNYVVAAQIFDATGANAISTPSPLVVTVNRYVPDSTAFAPTAAGRNPLWNNLPEIETYPTTDTTARVDRDVTGFLVTRYVNGTSTGTACQTFSPNLRHCQDTNPPSCCGSTVVYRIAPTGRNPDGSAHAGASTAASRNVNLPNTRPLEPEAVTIVRSGTQVTLSWTNPPGSGDPDAGDCIDFFRIYRRSEGLNSWEFTDRVDRTVFGNAAEPCGGSGESSNTITLIEDTSTTKRYRVTAVDTNLAESPREQVSG